MFSEKDLLQLKQKGISTEKVIEHIEIFINGIPFINLVNSATLGNGILKVSDDEKKAFINRFEEKMHGLNILKFVPASGAATRMFKHLYKFVDEFNPTKESFNSYVNREKASDMSTFFVGLDKLPFYKEVEERLLEKFPDYPNLADDIQKYHFVREMMLEEGFNYGNAPKGLLPFHRYKTHPATAFEEHLYESALYSASNGMANLHFTVSESHSDKFNAEFEKIEKLVEAKTGVAFTISFSFQKESTDTIAVDLEDKPFREADGSLHFRPSGHGALIENLNEQDADIIFIKNIDNVVVYRYKHEVADYKKMLAGILLQLQEKAFHYRKMLESNGIGQPLIDEIKQFLNGSMSVAVTPHFNKYRENFQIEYLKEKLDRPIRVCGMVRNEGEPGGGPFWVKDENGNVSLQIIESAQVDKSNKIQREILKTATHFNPVDLVCGVKDYKGKKYDLTKFIDPSQGFITQKTREGKELKALELPGLWNGAMANWNTVFVEVPLITFNPVKTVNDLLKTAHQVKA